MNRHMLAKLKLPDSPGVYRFIGSPKSGNRGNKILYIGRATSLWNRVRSYFSSDITEKRGSAIAVMIREAKTVKWETTDSVLESLILEANLIKKYQPKYNVKEKDDKSFNYIVITKEDFPRVLLMRGRELSDFTLHTKSYTLTAVFGPFPRGGVLRDALKIIRKIFPFRDTCTPVKIHSSILENTRIDRSCPAVDFGAAQRRKVTPSAKIHCRACFNAQIGLCPGVCSGAITQKEYGAIIKNLSLFLSGKKKVLVQKLKREMKIAAKIKEFELASELKRTIFALQHIQDVALIKNTDAFPRASASSQRGSAMCRVEAYDVAHIGATAMVGVMTVIENGEIEKSEYRKFKIKTVRGADDTASLAEVLSRRFGHPEWSYPQLIVVDGGMAQKNRAERVLGDMGIKIPIVSVVKDERHRPRNILGEKKYTQTYEKEILLANAEAHRFSITYHRRVRSSKFFGARK